MQHFENLDPVEEYLRTIIIYYQSCPGYSLTVIKKILYICTFKVPWEVNSSVLKLFKTNLLMPKDIAFISSNFGVHPCSHGQDTLDTKNVEGQTDR